MSGQDHYQRASRREVEDSWADEERWRTGRNSRIYRESDSRRTEVLALGMLCRVIGVGLTLFAGWVIWEGVALGFRIAGERPEDHMAIGSPAVEGIMIGAPCFIVALVLFVCARVADRRE